MPKSGRPPDIEHDTPPNPGFSTVVGRLVLTLAALALICYGALLAISRTEGFREIVREQIAKRTRMEVALVSARFDHSLKLLLEDLRLSPRASGGGPAGMRAQGVTLILRKPFKLEPDSITLQGAEFIFVVGESGKLAPEPLAPLSALIGDLLESSAVAGARTPVARARRPDAQRDLQSFMELGIAVEMDETALQWSMADGSLLERLDDFKLTCRPFQARAGQACYISIEAQRVTRTRAQSEQIEIEALRTSDGSLQVLHSD
jgi:hypothetical protein